MALPGDQLEGENPHELSHLLARDVGVSPEEAERIAEREIEMIEHNLKELDSHREPE